MQNEQILLQNNKYAEILQFLGLPVDFFKQSKIENIEQFLKTEEEEYVSYSNSINSD